MENPRKKIKTAQETPNSPNQSPTGVNTVDELHSPNLSDDRHEANLNDEHHHHHEISDVEESENSSSSSLLSEYNESISEEDNKRKQKLLFYGKRIKHIMAKIKRLHEKNLLQAAHSVEDEIDTDEDEIDTDEDEIDIDKYEINTNEDDSDIDDCQSDEDDTTLQLNNPNGIELSEDCLIEVFSYLSLDDMMEVKRVCKEWYQASQHWFKQMQTLVYNQSNHGETTLGFYDKYHKRLIHEEYECDDGNDDLLSILKSCGHYIKYYKVTFDIIEEEDGPYAESPDEECKELLFHWIPKLCKNIVELEISGDKDIYTPFTFKTMATQLRKLEKINIENLRQPVDENFYNLLRNNQQLKTVKLSFDMIFENHFNDELFIHLPTTIEKIELERIWFDEKKEPTHFISASKNLPSLKRLKIFDVATLSDAVVTAIANIKSITHLNLSNVRYYEYDRAIRPIANMTGLKSLILSSGYGLYEDNIINVVESCTELEHLVLNCRLTDKGLVAIAKLKKLKCLSIHMEKVSDKSIITSCESLEVLFCSFLKINNSEAIELLKKGTNLRYVAFSWGNNLTKDILQAANVIANDRKNNILCITGSFKDSSVDIDTPYFKYFKSRYEMPLEIFPENIRYYIELTNKR